MRRSCQGPRPRETSDFGPSAHPTRADVLLHSFQRARAETSLTFDAFAERLAINYRDQVPEHARSIDLVPPESPDYRTFARELDAAAARVKRYVRASALIPVDLEEPWINALPQGHAERCRQTLVQRFGFVAARAPAVAAASDGEAVGALLSAVGRATQSLAPTLDNGVINAADLADGALEADMAALEGTVASLRARIQLVRDRVDVDQAGRDFVERRAHVRPAATDHRPHRPAARAPTPRPVQ